MHLVTTPLNTFFAKLGPPGALTPDREHRGGGDASGCRGSRSSPGSGDSTSTPARCAGAARTPARPTSRGRRCRRSSIILKLRDLMHGGGAAPSTPGPADRSPPRSCGPARPAWPAWRRVRPSSTSSTPSSTCAGTSPCPRGRCRGRRGPASRTCSGRGTRGGWRRRTAWPGRRGWTSRASWRATRSSTSTGSGARPPTTGGTSPSPGRW